MLTIGTRGSKLALAQAHWVSGELTARGLENRVQTIKTRGDVVQDRFDKMEGKGFFTNEIESALRDGDIDLAVHCLKDLPTTSPDGLVNRAITERENPYDVILCKEAPPKKDGFFDLNGLTIGTSSNRRVFGLKHIWPDTTYVPIRGNVPTRIEKMMRGEADAVVLARAGLNRLKIDLSHLCVIDASPPLLVPAPAQGALALQMREDDTRDISFLHHQQTADCVNGERRVLKELGGGCQMPIGVLIQPVEEGFALHLFLGKMQGHTGETAKARMHIHLTGTAIDPLVAQVVAMLRNPAFKVDTGRE